MQINFISLSPDKFRGGVQVSPTRLACALQELGHEIVFNARRGYFDIIHVHNAFTLMPMKRFGKTPIISHGHSVRADLEGGVIALSLFKPLLVKLMRRVYSASRFIIPVSEFAEKEIRDLGIDRPTRVISNGVPLASFPYATDKERWSARRVICDLHNIPEDNTIALTVSSLFPRKGIADAVRFAREHPEITLLWIGKSHPIYPFTFLRRKMGKLPPNFLLLGYVEEVLNYYHGSDVYLSFSHVETEGIPLLEAAASGLPIVARDIPAFSWLEDGKHCLKFSVTDNIGNLVYKILAENKGYRSESFSLVQQLDMPNIARRVEEVYREVM